MMSINLHLVHRVKTNENHHKGTFWTDLNFYDKAGNLIGLLTLYSEDGRIVWEKK